MSQKEIRKLKERADSHEDAAEQILKIASDQDLPFSKRAELVLAATHERAMAADCLNRIARFICPACGSMTDGVVCEPCFSESGFGSADNE